MQSHASCDHTDQSWVWHIFLYFDRVSSLSVESETKGKPAQRDVIGVHVKSHS